MLLQAAVSLSCNRLQFASGFQEAAECLMDGAAGAMQLGDTMMQLGDIMMPLDDMLQHGDIMMQLGDIIMQPGDITFPHKILSEMSSYCARHAWPVH